MNALRCAVALLVLLLTTAVQAGEAAEHRALPSNVAGALTHYSGLLAKITASKGRQNLEPLFTATRKLKAALLSGAGDEVVIEQLTGEQFDLVVRQARGVIVNREEVLLVEPDAPFFLSLARTHGRKADVQFAEAYAATYGDGVWPSYLMPQTDVTACTDFGSGELVARYAAWLSFRSRYPKAYRSEVLAQLREIESNVAESLCACGSSADVISGLEAFATAFPASARRIGVAERLAALRSGRSAIRFDCLSG